MKNTIKFILASFLCSLAILFIIGTINSDKTTIPNKFKGKHIFINGTPIRYLQLGRGPDLLLIHGCPGSIEDWFPLIPYLKNSFRITLYDRPGYGFSGTKKVKYTIKNNTEIALALIKKLQLTKTTIIGHSLGGTIAIALAIKNSNQIKKSIILSGKLFPPSNKETILYLINLPLIGRGISKAALSFFGVNIFKSFVQKAFAPSPIPKSFLANRKQLWGQAKVLTSIAKEVLADDKQLSDLATSYKNIKKSVYLIHGTKDKTANVWEAQKVNKLIKQSKLSLIKNGGHYLHYSHTKKIAALIHKLAQ